MRARRRHTNRPITGCINWMVRQPSPKHALQSGMWPHRCVATSRLPAMPMPTRTGPGSASQTSCARCVPRCERSHSLPARRSASPGTRLPSIPACCATRAQLRSLHRPLRRSLATGTHWRSYRSPRSPARNGCAMLGLPYARRRRWSVWCCCTSIAWSRTSACTPDAHHAWPTVPTKPANASRWWSPGTRY